METGLEACQRLGLPYLENDDPGLWALARAIAEQAAYEWDRIPFHNSEASVDQTYYLLLAKGFSENLQKLNYKIVPGRWGGTAHLPSRWDSEELVAAARTLADGVGMPWDSLPRFGEDHAIDQRYYLQSAHRELSSLAQRGFRLASTVEAEG